MAKSFAMHPLRAGVVTNPMSEDENGITRRLLVGLGMTGAAAAIVYAAVPGCRKTPVHTGHPPDEASYTGLVFENVTASAGIDFKHVNGGFGQKWLPETMGSGLAWIDYDNDGYQDLFIVNSREWTAAERLSGHQPADQSNSPSATCKLYHNNGNGTFTDVTRLSHLDVPMYGMGVCAGDFDNDGHTDLFVTSLMCCYLFRNNGDGTFTDISDKAGVRGSGWSTSAAFVDYDKDGHLDLIVCHYVNWTPATNRVFLTNGHPTYTTPQKYVGIPPTLYHNNGDGTFTDVSAKAGILHFIRAVSGKLKGKSLGVAILDYDNDGWPDIAIANDTEPNYLFHNLKNGTFEEVGVEMGIAYADRGGARGAMGIDASDYDHSGYESLIIGNFSNQQLAMYHNERGVNFRDVASQNGLGPASLLSLSFGLFFFDMDNDGWDDLFVANGHVDDDVEETQKRVLYAEQPLLFRNLANGRFQDVSNNVGASIKRKIVGRGAAYADYNLDGAVDIAVTTNNGPAYLYKNHGCANHSLRLELQGVKSNRSAIGALVAVKCCGQTQTYLVRSGSSYCSQSELPITIGLGSATEADSITITWPHEQAKPTVLNNVSRLRQHLLSALWRGKGIVKDETIRNSILGLNKSYCERR